MNSDEKGAGVGRTAQRQPRMKIVAPVKALFWLVLQALKQTALPIGSVSLTPLVVGTFASLSLLQ